MEKGMQNRSTQRNRHCEWSKCEYINWKMATEIWKRKHRVNDGNSLQINVNVTNHFDGKHSTNLFYMLCATMWTCFHENGKNDKETKKDTLGENRRRHSISTVQKFSCDLAPAAKVKYRFRFVFLHVCYPKIQRRREKKSQVLVDSSVYLQMFCVQVFRNALHTNTNQYSVWLIRWSVRCNGWHCAHCS